MTRPPSFTGHRSNPRVALLPCNLVINSLGDHRLSVMEALLVVEGDRVVHPALHHRLPSSRANVDFAVVTATNGPTVENAWHNKATNHSSRTSSSA